MKRRTAGLLITSAALGAILAILAATAGLLDARVEPGPITYAHILVVAGLGARGIRHLV